MSKTAATLFRFYRALRWPRIGVVALLSFPITHFIRNYICGAQPSCSEVFLFCWHPLFDDDNVFNDVRRNILSY